MAFNFQPGSYTARPYLDFSGLANAPNSFWEGRDQARQNQARKDVSEALKRGDYQAAIAALAEANPEGALTAGVGMARAGMPDWRSNGVGGLYDANSTKPPQVVYPGAEGGGGGPPNTAFTPGSTPDQSKAQGFYNSGAEADTNLTKLAPTVNKESSLSAAARHIPEDAGMGLGGWAARGFVDPDAQNYEQAAIQFVNAINYRDSGANVNAKEMANAYKIYIPRAGDSDATLAQKAQARATKLRSIQGQGGPMFNPQAQPAPSGGGETSQYKDGQTATNPQTGEKLLFQNGSWVPVR